MSQLSQHLPNPQDLEDQENELIVLESILDKDKFVYNNDNEQIPPSGQIQIDIELPKQFEIVVKSRINSNVNNLTPPPSLSTSKVDLGQEDGEGNPQPLSSSYQQQQQLLYYDKDIKTAEICFLPPITLLFTLPSNYPSTESPLYTLQSNWLDRHTLSHLCHSLDSIWSKQQGTVVLFSWITFLREETLKIIGCDKQFEVALHSSRRTTKQREKQEEGCVSVSTTNTTNNNNNICSTSVGSSDNNGSSTSTKSHCPHSRHSRLRSFHNHHHNGQILDQRAVFLNSSIRDKEILFNFLVEYSKEREETEFRKQYHSCQVCFTDKAGTDFIRLSCGHCFCKDCMHGCYTTHIKEGGIDAVKCLAVKCSGMPTSAQVHEIVGKDLFERYDGMLLQRALEGMTDLIYCPRSQCGKPVIVEADEKLAWCSHCLYRFCSICKMVYHGVEPCRFKNDEKQKLFENYNTATKEERIAMEKTYGKKQLSLLVESTLSEKYIEKESKPCPHCKVPIEKFEGCNKVTCTKCGAYFCWMCSKHLDKGNPYFHFQDVASPCFNQLFENAGGEIDSDDDNEDFEFSEDDDDWD